MQQQIQANYKQIKTDIIQLITDELSRIENDPKLAHLIRKEEGV
jgi:putative mobilization protein